MEIALENSLPGFIQEKPLSLREPHKTLSKTKEFLTVNQGDFLSEAMSIGLIIT